MAKMGRPPLDEVVYKVRFRHYSGVSLNRYFSVRRQARMFAKKQSDAGRLLFFGEYNLVKVHGRPRG